MERVVQAPVQFRQLQILLFVVVAAAAAVAVVERTLHVSI